MPKKLFFTICSIISTKSSSDPVECSFKISVKNLLIKCRLVFFSVPKKLWQIIKIFKIFCHQMFLWTLDTLNAFLKTLLDLSASESWSFLLSIQEILYIHFFGIHFTEMFLWPGRVQYLQHCPKMFQQITWYFNPKLESLSSMYFAKKFEEKGLFFEAYNAVLTILLKTSASLSSASCGYATNFCNHKVRSDLTNRVFFQVFCVQMILWTRKNEVQQSFCKFLCQVSNSSCSMRRKCTSLLVLFPPRSTSWQEERL